MAGRPSESLLLIVGSSVGEKVAWLQEKVNEKGQLEVLCGSPTNNNLLYLAARIKKGE